MCYRPSPEVGRIRDGAAVREKDLARAGVPEHKYSLVIIKMLPPLLNPRIAYCSIQMHPMMLLHFLWFHVPKKYDSIAVNQALEFGDKLAISFRILIGPWGVVIIGGPTRIATERLKRPAALNCLQVWSRFLRCQPYRADDWCW